MIAIVAHIHHRFHDVAKMSDKSCTGSCDLSTRSLSLQKSCITHQTHCGLLTDPVIVLFVLIQTFDSLRAQLSRARDKFTPQST